MPAGSAAVASQIGQCYLSLANSRTVGIPVLEQRANEHKQSALYVAEQTLDQGRLDYGFWYHQFKHISAYNAWVKDILKGIQGAITSQMDTLIPFAFPNSVLLTWANLDPAVPANKDWTPDNNKNTAMSNANLISIKSVATADLKAMPNRLVAPSYNSDFIA
ncbi:Chitin-binding type-1 domain-containing protein [Mycena sanguinolenta]|uniref:Chitin-binding type-1 domain-containing protein n=1 Tax=Mycena sanguinolenta TaxID=230812 RepID=A0A8H7CVF6_9AGAR|nr:Chitin-binding type-1 domain-containing protein [Mycena sanguinolenta]